MTRARHSPLIAFVAASLGVAAAAQPQPTAHQQYALALRAIEQGKADQAAQSLAEVIERADAEAIKHAAGVVHSQITGAFNRRHAVWLKRDVADVVVLVDSPADFLAAIERWTDERWFPVLIDDGWYSAMFIRAFKPARVVRFDADDAAEPPATADAVRAAIAAHNKRLGDRPADAPGLVVIDPDHPGALAALALAIGRGQPVFTYKPTPLAQGEPNAEALGEVNQSIMAHATGRGLVRVGEWFGLTLAGDYPVGFTANKQKLAVDDALGRRAGGMRLAVIGRLHGYDRQIIYHAMASLFLQPDAALLVDDYTNRGGGAFERYVQEAAHKALAQVMKVTRLSGTDVTPVNFLQTAQRLEPGMIWINSSGHVKKFDLRGAGSPDELPMGFATVYHFIHSFSAQRIDRDWSLAGRAIANGAYWYFGAIDEPYLHAFAAPTGMAIKYASGTPLAFAARQSPGHPMSRPWKLICLGDPLLSHRKTPANRVAVDDLPDGFAPLAAGDDVVSRFRRAMHQPGQAADAALALLRATADKPAVQAKLEPGELATAIWLARDKPEARQWIVQANPTVVNKLPAGGVMLLDASSAHFNATVDEDHAAALPALKTLVAAHRNPKATVPLIRRWIASAAKHGQDGAAAAALRQWARQAAPNHARKAINRALAPAQ